LALVQTVNDLHTIGGTVDIFFNEDKVVSNMMVESTHFHMEPQMLVVDVTLKGVRDSLMATLPNTIPTMSLVTMKTVDGKEIPLYVNSFTADIQTADITTMDGQPAFVPTLCELTMTGSVVLDESQKTVVSTPEPPEPVRSRFQLLDIPHGSE